MKISKHQHLKPLMQCGATFANNRESRRVLGIRDGIVIFSRGG